MGPPHPSEALRGQRGAHLAGKRIGLGVDAARGAAGAVRMARELLRLGADVQPLLAPEAESWCPPASLEYATGRAPMAWPPVPDFDAVLLSPLGPGLAAKLRLGLRDTAPAAAALQILGKAPVLAALAPGAGADAAALEAAGVRVVRGAFDAHGEAAVELVATRVAGALSASRLKGKSLLVIAGGGFEPLDAMRVVATRGEAGLARSLRQELERRGARVSLLMGPWAGPRQHGEKGFESVRDLVLEIPLAGRFDAAFVEEGLPSLAPVKHAGKIPSGQPGLSLELHAQEGPAKALREAAGNVISYKAEGDPAAQARALADRAEGRA